MLRLTLEEQDMLQGKYGKLKQQAMRKTVEYAEILGADELCEVTMAHLFCGAHGYLSAAGARGIDEVISIMQYDADETLPLENMVCYCQSDCGPMDPGQFRLMGFSEEDAAKNREYLNRYRFCGVNIVGTCVPYMCGFIPLRGEHFVSSESHAVVLMNSLWSACGNADGLEAGFWAAACGRTPKWGNHIMSNRFGTHVFDIRTPIKSSTDWDLLGYTIGKKLPSHSVPVLTGLSDRPSIFTLKYFFAALATTSGAEMCHIVGITPEAPTVEAALGGKEALETIAVTRDDLIGSYHSLGGGTACDRVDYISIGCPHYSIEELRLAAELLRGKKVVDGTTLHIWTAPQIKASADSSGYTKIFEDAGATLLSSSCPLVSGKLPEGVETMAFDSAKQAHYLMSGHAAKVLYGSMKSCIQAAVTGKWGNTL